MKVRQLIIFGLAFFLSAASLMAARAQEAPARPLTNQDVIGLLKDEKLSVEELRARIGGGASNFDLSAAGLKQLQEAGVDASVVAAMIQSPRFKGDWYVADLYEYLDSVQLSGTNFIPSLFSPLFPGVVYLILLGLLWLGAYVRAHPGKRSKLPHVFAAIVLVLLAAGALTGATNLLEGAYHAVSVAELEVAYLKKPISPDESPCIQVQRRPLLPERTRAAVAASPSKSLNVGSAAGAVITEQPTLSPLATPTAVREADDASSKTGSRTLAESAPKCRQPETSASPAPGPIGKVMAADGSTGDVSLVKTGSRYVLTVPNLSRAGKYTGHVSSDVIAPAAMRVTLNVADWWPYFFVAVALGALFSNYTFKPRLSPSLPHGTQPESRVEMPEAQREVAEAFVQASNSVAVSTLSALAAVVLQLYANYNEGWGRPVDYVSAFLGGAAITLGLRALAGAANAASTRVERALRREPARLVNEVHFQPPKAGE